MQGSISHYRQNTPDWRLTLRLNTRRTFLVITLFFFLYISLGLLIDLYIYSEHYTELPLDTLLRAITTFKLIPKATVITSSIALFSLLLTLKFSNRLMLLGAKSREITPEKFRSQEERQLYNVVQEMRISSGLRFMPRVYLIDVDYMNAFASGYSEKSAMVAITKGLMNKLKRDELQAVMAHELSHIQHMDIRLTLMASVLSNLMLIVIDIFFYGAFFSRGDRRESSGWLLIFITILRYLLPLITLFLMLFLSRTREYMADAGCVKLMRNNEPLARALLKIQDDHQKNRATYQEIYDSTAHESIRRPAYIFDPSKVGIKAIGMSDAFSSHPNLQKRLEAIGFFKKE